MSPSDTVHFVKRIFGSVQSICEYFGVVLLTMLTLLAAMQIFVRFFGAQVDFNAVWTAELARYCLVIMTFVGVPYAMRTNENISIRPLLKQAPVAVQKPLLTLSNIIIVVFSVLIVFSVNETARRTLSVGLPTVEWITVGYAQVILAIAFALAALFAVEETIELFRSEDSSPIRNDEEENEGYEPQSAETNATESE